MGIVFVFLRRTLTNISATTAKTATATKITTISRMSVNAMGAGVDVGLDAVGVDELDGEEVGTEVGC